MSTNKRLARGGALDALRFLAAAFIVVFHFGDEAPTPLRALHVFFDRGYLATDFFLLLSGFVLAHAYGPSILSGRLGMAQFVLKRLARNYPAHVITLGGLVLMVLAALALGRPLSHPEQYDWSAIPAHLLLMHGWGLSNGTWNAPTWTVSALAACYVVFPFSWPLFQRIGRPQTCLLTALALLVALDILTHAFLGSSAFCLPFRWGLLRAFPLFMTGQLLARFVETADLGPRQARSLALAGVAAFAGLGFASGPDIACIAAIAAVIVGCGAAPAGRPWPGAEWAAKISFSLFFTHTLSAAVYSNLVGPLVARLGAGQALEWTVWGLGLVFALVVATLFHHLIDEPIQAQIRPRLANWRPRRAPHPAPAPSV